MVSLTLEQEGPMSNQIGKKRNTKSSTEEYIVGVDIFLTQSIWYQYFLRDQGYEIHDNVIYQYNQGAIQLENNGR